MPFSGYNLQRGTPGDYHIGDAGFDSLFGCRLISPLKNPYFFSFVAYVDILMFQMYRFSSNWIFSSHWSFLLKSIFNNMIAKW